jgi:Arc/MetJ-type ribon-helix-helix transcriptional regulator
MKLVTIKISLSSDLAEFAQNDLEKRSFDSMSEYIGDLIRKRRKEAIDTDVEFLEKAMKEALSGDPTDGEMEEIYTSIKAQRNMGA